MAPHCRGKVAQLEELRNEALDTVQHLLGLIEQVLQNILLVHPMEFCNLVASTENGSFCVKLWLTISWMIWRGDRMGFLTFWTLWWRRRLPGLKINIDAVKKKKNYTWVWCRYFLEKLAAEASGRRPKWQKSEQTCMVSLFHAQVGCLVICLLSDKRVLHMVMLLGGGTQSLVVDEKELSRWFQINTM